MATINGIIGRQREIVLLKELEKATYGDENSRHNNHPDAFI